jgi:hypothetical protein
MAGRAGSLKGETFKRSDCVQNIEEGGGSRMQWKCRMAFAISLMFIALLTGCSRNTAETQSSMTKEETIEMNYSADTKIWDVIDDPVFEGYGRLIFPADKTIDKSMTLSEVGNLLNWYNYVNSDRTVEIVNDMRTKAAANVQIFYDIYTDEEKTADPAKENTGLFFFRGNPGEKFAIVSAGGGFVYVAAMHDSFPHALELSKMGYNAFALIYRPGAETACEDLARAIAYIHDMRMSLRWTRRIIPCGEVQQVRGWRLGLDHTEQRLLEKRNTRCRERSLCNIRDFPGCTEMSRRHMQLWVPVTALQAIVPWRDALIRSRQME